MEPPVIHITLRSRSAIDNTNMGCTYNKNTSFINIIFFANYTLHRNTMELLPIIIYIYISCVPHTQHPIMTDPIYTFVIYI